MPDWLAWMLNLRGLPSDERGLSLSMAVPLPAWGWALIATGAVILAVWSYQRLAGSRRARVALGAARGLLLLLLAVLLCGPKLSRVSETIERDWVLLLVDRSASMTVSDAPGGLSGARISREEQLRLALSQHAETWVALARDRVAAWLGFDSGLYELGGTSGVTIREGRPVALAPPSGRRSDLGSAIQEALAKAAARRISGIVVFSDGQATDEVPEAVKRRLKADLTGVFVVPLGSPLPLADLRVRAVDRPEAAFVRDVVPIDATVELSGPAGTKVEARAQLIDRRTGAVLDERPVVFEDSAGEVKTGRVRLGSTPSEAGEAEWAVRLVTSGADLVRPPVDAPVTITLIDRPLRVLYLDGYPRWEYRYLKNLLARERSVNFAALLMAPGRRYLQEGTTTLSSLPTTPKEWDEWDVIVLGDVRPEVFSREQLAQMRRRVAVGGAGLLWIGGQGPTPGAWRTTPLGDLIPFQLSGDAGGPEAWGREVVMKPAPLAERLGVLRLADSAQEDGTMWPAAVSNPGTGWSRLRWVQRIDASLLKPATEVLAEVVGFDPAGRTEGSASPAVMTMRFGSGRVIYVATDEIWRWRYGRGEDLPERFWLQLVRLLGRDAVAKAGRPAIVTITPPRATVGQAVTVNVQIVDQSLLDATRTGVTVRVQRVGTLPGGAPGGDEGSPEPPVDLTLRPVALSDDGGGGVGSEARVSAVFAGTWIPLRTGLYKAVLTDASLTKAGEAAPEAQAEVYLPDDELRRPQSDHPRLEALAKETGGQVVPVDKLDELQKLLPRRERRLPGVGHERTLWDSPLALVLVLGLLTLEWVGRRLIRLI